MNEFRAVLRFTRISARKLRMVGDLVRGKNVVEALGILGGCRQRGAELLAGVIKSARANAVKMDEERELNIEPDGLVISDLQINGGPIIPRFRAMSMGRGGKIRKRTAHIEVTLKEPLGAAARIGEAR